MNPSFPPESTVYFIAWGCSHHRLSKCLLDERDTALVDRFTVRQEATLQGRSHRGQTLEGKKDIYTGMCINDNIHHWEEVLLKSRHFNDHSLKGLASGSEQIREHNVSFLMSMSWVFHHIQTRVFTSMST